MCFSQKVVAIALLEKSCFLNLLKLREFRLTKFVRKVPSIEENLGPWFYPVSRHQNMLPHAVSGWYKTRLQKYIWQSIYRVIFVSELTVNKHNFCIFGIIWIEAEQ